MRNRRFVLVLMGWLLAFSFSNTPGIYPAQAESIEFAAGEPVKGPLIPIWSDAIMNIPQAVVYNENHDEYLVVWVSKQDEFTWDIWGRRIGADGTLYPEFVIATTPGKKLEAADAAFSTLQDRYYVVFQYPFSENDIDIHAVSFRYDGNFFSGWIPVDTNERKQVEPAITYFGFWDDFLIVYTNQLADGTSQIQGRRFNPAGGIPLDPVPVEIAKGAGQTRDQPDVAYNPKQANYLVAYRFSQITPVVRSFIGAKLVSADLTVISTERQLSAENEGGAVSLAAGNDEFLAVWDIWNNYYFIRACRVKNDGTPLGPTGGFSISEGSSSDVIFRWWPEAAANRLGYWPVWGNQSYYYSILNDVSGNYIPLGKDQAIGNGFIVDDDVFDRGGPKIACSWMGKCLVVDWYYPDANPTSDIEIHGRFLSWPEIYLPYVTR